MYNSLPIYHGNGGMIVIALCFCEGITIVLRKKFSATNFWKECAQYKCTVRNINEMALGLSHVSYDIE